MKRSVKKEWHAPKSPVGSGDYYGTGIKQPVGKPVRSYLTDTISKSELSTPPKKIA